MKAYAVKTELESYLPAALSLPEDPELDRLLMRASERVDEMVTEIYDVDDTDELPTDANVAAVIKKATCLQAVFMIQAGEDIEGVGGSQVSTGSFSGKLPGRFSKDARGVLQDNGLINGPSKWSSI